MPELGQYVLVDGGFCPRCAAHTGEMTGRIVGFEVTSMLESDGHVGQFYLVDVHHPHNGGAALVYAESELAAIGANQ